ncbi:ABC transporter permease [Methanogenium organophilum]|uniref:ABC transporter permease subunit n=1 Tax=Methanogenium organophilum TaxID=2199 RepID=A0A9X9S4N0_METOG|nr:ABC transporter permease subunit [Methanogenium organophilum]WAI01395.1 ABC transporter permease subunit [Methanogenium organophilum]
MNLSRLSTISKKEFSDHIGSKRLIFILALFCLFLSVKAANGVVKYNELLEAYGAGYSHIIFLPSPVEVFSGIVTGIGTEGLGIIIGLALGFDLISGERERRTLKTILSQPVYRDELINGKAIGGVATLTVISVTGFIFVIAVMLILGIVPNLDELLGIGIIWIITLLFMITSFSLALMTSVITKTSSASLILSLAIIFLILFVLPFGLAALTNHILLGQPPVPSSQSFNSGSEMYEFQEKNNEYQNKKRAINDFFHSISIKQIYDDITLPIIAPSTYQARKDFGKSTDPDSPEEREKPGFWSLIDDQLGKVVVFILWPVIFFGIAYVRFMKADLR